LLFSEREGLKPIKDKLQIDSMDKDLRNGLWNAFYEHYWQQIIKNALATSGIPLWGYPESIKEFFRSLWADYFKEPIDAIDYDKALEDIKSKVFNNSARHEVYSFLEFVVKSCPNEDIKSRFMKECNRVLEREHSAYRFIGELIIRIDSKEEKKEIEEALQASPKPVREHLNQALALFADRENPDYRNSIKEAICAVEALCKLIVGEDKVTLGKALKWIEGKGVKLHPAFKTALDKLYGYASDEGGIRHSLMEESKIYFEDAKFLLVCCSAFINYLIAKAERTGIELGI